MYLHKSKPVSYTHLDVYKRQAIGNARLVEGAHGATGLLLGHAGDIHRAHRHAIVDAGAVDRAVDGPGAADER